MQGNQWLTRPDHKAVLLSGSVMFGGYVDYSHYHNRCHEFYQLSTVLKKTYDASTIKLQFFVSSSSVPAKSPG